MKSPQFDKQTRQNAVELLERVLFEDRVRMTIRMFVHDELRPLLAKAAMA